MNITSQAWFKAILIVFILPFPIVFVMGAIGYEGGFWENYGMIAGVLAIPVTVIFVLLYVVKVLITKNKENDRQ